MHRPEKKMYANREKYLSDTQPEQFLLYTVMGFKFEKKNKLRFPVCTHEITLLHQILRFGGWGGRGGDI